jgi:hypothetical protein
MEVDMYDNNYADKWENPAYVAAVKANIRNNANKTFLKSYERAEEISDYLEKIYSDLQNSDRSPVSFLEKLSASLREYGKLSPKQYESVCKVIDAAQKKRDSLKSAIQDQKNHAESIGVKSEKFESTVTVKKIITIKVTQFSRYDSDEAHIYIFNDQDNNAFVWKTKNILSNTANEFAWNLENDNAVKEGDVIVIKASIKAYTEYKGEKQTLIQRVKILEVK